MKNRIIPQWAKFILLFAILISIIWFWDGLAKATGESGLLFATIAKHFQFTQHAWIDTVIGETAFSSNGAFPIFALFYTLNQFFPGGIIQAMFFGSIILIGALGVSLLAKELFPEIDKKHLAFIGIAYVFNPYSIPFVWNRFLYNHIFSYGLIPLLLFFWVRLIKKRDRKLLLLFFFISFFGSFAFTGISFLLAFLIGAGFWTATFLFAKEDRLNILKRSVLLGVVFISSQLFWLLPFYAGNRLAISTSASFFSEEGNLRTTLELSNYYGGIVNKITQIRADMPELAYDGIPWAQWYNTTAIHYASFVPIVLIVICALALLYLKVKNRYKLGSIFLLTLLVVNGTAAPLGTFYLLLYKIHPVLQTLRNPYEKMGVLFYIIFFIVWGVGLWALSKSRLKMLSRALFVISLCWWGINAWPVFNGLVFTYKYDLYKDPKIGFRVKVPAYYEQANEYINQEAYESRLLALPMTGEGVTHKWEYGYDGVESYNGLFTKPVISLDTTSGKLPEIAKFIRRANTADVMKAAGILNISTIITRNDLIPPTFSPLPDTWAVELSEQAKATTFGDHLQVFKVPDSLQKPRIFATNNIYSANKVVFDPLSTPDKTHVVSPKPEGIRTSGQLIYPNIVINDSSGVSFKTPEEAILFLPHVRFQRDSLIYPLIRLKDELWKITKPQELKVIHITLSLKRLAEIEHLLNKQRTNEVKAALDDYKVTITPLILEAASAIALNGDDQHFWEELFKVHDDVLTTYIKSAKDEELTLLTSVQENLLTGLVQSGVYSMYQSKLPQIPSAFVRRVRFSVEEDGLYQLQMIKDTNIGLSYADIIQVNETLVNTKPAPGHIASDTVEVKLKKGDNEIRIPVKQINADIALEEFELGSLREGQLPQSNTWTVDTPPGNGEITVSFEYRVIKGQGPKVKVIAENNTSKPLFENTYPADNYYFGWVQKYITIPFHRDTKKLTFTISSIPINNCIGENKIDTKCLNLPFKELYDKHSDVLIRNIQSAIRPSATFRLTQLNDNQAPIADPSVTWQKVNPSVYRLQIDELKNSAVLMFLEQFHSGWSLYKDPEELTKNNAKDWTTANSFENITKTPFYAGFTTALKTYLLPEVSADHHLTAEGYANGWAVEKPGGYILVFRPQRFLYIGWVATLTSAALLVIFVSKSFYKRKVNVKKKNK